ncbi:MAG: type I methionyl aminopeptidase [Candidatus Saganbacteria bacterium]|nr:type I methionyl aminopeptidase [Candidatus Saganbacteria bacterium]
MILIKNREEVEKIRRACQIVAKILELVKARVVPGAVIFELDAFAEEEMIKAGGQPAFKGYRGYSHATCMSLNEEIVHGIPNNRVLKEGDLLAVDVGVIFEDYYGDAAETCAVGRISGKKQKLLDVTKETLFLGIEKARAGNHLGDISAVIERNALKHGYQVVRELYGHGVGKNLHEDPLIPNFGKEGEGPELKAGMVLAIEPMLNMGTWRIKTLGDGWTVVTADGSLSAHFEHTILLTKGEPEVLSLLKG